MASIPPLYVGESIYISGEPGTLQRHLSRVDYCTVTVKSGLCGVQTTSTFWKLQRLKVHRHKNVFEKKYSNVQLECLIQRQDVSDWTDSGGLPASLEARRASWDICCRVLLLGKAAMKNRSTARPRRVTQAALHTLTGPFSFFHSPPRPPATVPVDRLRPQHH